MPMVVMLEIVAIMVAVGDNDNDSGGYDADSCGTVDWDDDGDADGGDYDGDNLGDAGLLGSRTKAPRT